MSRTPGDLALELTASCPARARVEQQLTLAFTLTLSIPARSLFAGTTRVLTLAAQHVRLPRPAPPLLVVTPQPVRAPIEPFTPRLPSGYSTPTTVVPAVPVPQRAAFDAALTGRLLAASPRRALFPLSPSTESEDVGGEGPSAGPGIGVRLPAPVPTPGDEVKYERMRGVTPIGVSAVMLTPVRISAQSDTEAALATGTVSFVLQYLPLRKGFNMIGGLRVYLADDRVVGAGDEGGLDKSRGDKWTQEAKLLREWDIVGEIWVEG